MSKIFGVSLPKTGQTSLASAMEILGYKTVQYPRKLSEIEEYDFALDLMVTAHYKELDKKYPGSKFIMTIRDHDTWIKSMENHYRNHPVSQRSQLLLDMRKKFWGTIHFDKEKATKKYHDHTKEVKNYFKDREDDLLTINIIAGEGWEKLCKFLKREIPNKPFPHKNIGDYN